MFPKYFDPGRGLSLVFYFASEFGLDLHGPIFH